MTVIMESTLRKRVGKKTSRGTYAANMVFGSPFWMKNVWTRSCALNRGGSCGLLIESGRSLPDISSGEVSVFSHPLPRNLSKAVARQYAASGLLTFMTTVSEGTPRTLMSRNLLNPW